MEVKFYAMTGIVDGDAYHAIIQAESIGIAERLFNENVKAQMCVEFELSAD